MITKRSNAPIFFPIKRKSKKFIVSTNPGPHKKDRSIPLGVILRDILGVADNMKEAKEILGKSLVKVDNKIRKDRRFPAGLMDIVTVGEQNFRIMPNKKGLYLKEIKDENVKLLKLTNKTYVKGKLQLNFDNGTNRLEEGEYSTGDTLVIDISSGKITDHIKMEKGSTAIIIKGKNSGVVGKIDDIKITFGSEPSQVILDSDGTKMMVPKDYIFVIGTKEPVIKM